MPNWKKVIVSGSDASLRTLVLQSSGSSILDIQGSEGQLFSVTDSLTGVLLSVNDISGIPIFEVSSDDTVKMGTFGAEGLIVSGSDVTLRNDATINSLTVGRGNGNILTNVALGDEALLSNTTGGFNTAVGNRALLKNTTGFCNTAVGSYALACNTTASRNTAMGSLALCATTTGANNTAMGFYALRQNTTGTCNTALGNRALQCNTTGTCNTAVGNYALCSNTTGIRNTALGNFALRNNTTGVCNTAVGNLALRSNTTGTRNTAVGNFALCSNTTGVRNTALGTSALQSNTTGFYNVAVGAYALSSNTGNYNVALGNFALCSNTTGVRNTVLGHRAFLYNTTGACNTIIGNNAGVYLTNTNIIAVGYNANPSSTNNHTVWGNSSNNVCNCVYVAWSTVSDCRDKEEIKPLSPNLGLNLLRKIEPVSFKWDHRDSYVQKCSYEYGKKDGTLIGDKEHYGIIAQDLRKALDELGETFDALGHDQDKDAYRVTYEELIAPMIQAIKELDKRLIVVEEKVAI